VEQPVRPATPSCPHIGNQTQSTSDNELMPVMVDPGLAVPGAARLPTLGLCRQLAAPLLDRFERASVGTRVLLGNSSRRRTGGRQARRCPRVRPTQTTGRRGRSGLPPPARVQDMVLVERLGNRQSDAVKNLAAADGPALRRVGGTKGTSLGCAPGHRRAGRMHRVGVSRHGADQGVAPSRRTPPWRTHPVLGWVT
jgi:hypothetical protein